VNSINKIICLKCPRGCEINVEIDNNQIININGNKCKLGIDYAKDEVTNPKRILTTTVKVKNGKYPLVPVWTDKPIPKNKIIELANILRNFELEAPVNVNQIVLSNIFDSDVNVLTSFYVEKVDEK